MKQQSGVALALLLWWLAPACSLLVDSAALEQGCEPGHKPCELEPGKLTCVSTADPEYGCARESCVPCTLPHTVEVCGGDGDCAVGTCDRGYENCDLLAKTGCEVPRDTSYAHCGSCNSSCEDAVRSMPRAVTSECHAGRCEVGECQPGYADCDGAATNGCERALPPEACGRCDGCPGPTQCNVDEGRCE